MRRKTRWPMAPPKGKRVALTQDRAGELFVGGLVGLLDLAPQLKMPEPAAAAILVALKVAVKQVTPAALVTIWRKLGGDMPPEVAGVVGRPAVATARSSARAKKPKRSSAGRVQRQGKRR